MRAVIAVLLSSACAATLTSTQALKRLPLTRPALGWSAQDTIVALSIREAVLGGTSVGLSRQVVVLRVPDLVSSHALPRIDSIAFYVLDTLQVENLPRRARDFTYLRPFPPRINGDTAVVFVAWRHGLGPIFSGVGSCSWRAVRRSGVWVVDTSLGCVVW